MGLQATDPRSIYGAGKNPQTGTDSIGGQLDVQGIDLGNGFCALATINLTRTKTSVASATSSTQLLAADSSRLAVSIANDANKTLHVALNGSTAFATSPISVAAGAAFSVKPNDAAGKISGIWDASPSGNADITATTA